ncbi:MAG: uracil phosphoribosyltransferase [Bacteroidota bacterium]
MKIHNLSETNSVANNFLAEIRDVKVQNDRLRFRKNLSRLGEILAYEMSKHLDFEEESITTPLSSVKQKVINKQPILISILRAGMPFFEGVQSFFDHADAGFVGAFRSSDFSATSLIELSYFAVPDLSDKILVIADPMLATGQSVIDTIDQLKRYGTPRKVFLLAVIAAPEGIKNIENNCDVSIDLWCGAIDEKLNNKAYIVPGLGDAGDLAYGPKL